MKQLFTAATLALSATVGSALAQTEISYWMWDANQKPAYEACARAFERANPDIKVKVEQKGWDDYWTNITTGLVSGTAPDVFTSHLAKYPEFANNGQIVDLAPLIKRDNLNTKVYYPGLFDLWGKDGKQYGLPKDWDTVAIIYNKKMLRDAGVTEAQLRNWTWNPKDGGTFGQILARLTRDKNGNNALSPRFDPKNVVQYGWLSPNGGGYGQTEWSWLAVPNGFKFNDGPWSRKYYYDSPKLAEAIQWLADLSLKRGIAVPAKDLPTSGGVEPLFTSGKAAMMPQGSWMISYFRDNTKFEYGWALLPRGPNGRKSMFNGLADNIWVGSKKQEQAWKWVRFMGSAACQNIVGSYGVVFPAIKSGVDAALKAHASKGIDVSAFTSIANAPGGTFLFPIADNASEVSSIMQAAMDSIFLGKSTAAQALKEANEKVNATFR
ncbi:MAG: sugar ABC transporter substrate-binding protein [Meiothermus sp.]|nr:sugar ABC transporter substrate-binding protein [Meiothermus sp.]